VLVSEPLELLITKCTPAEIEAAGADNVPCVPPGVFTVKNIIELAVTAVVATVIVPPDIADEVPIEAFDPVVIRILFPAVESIRLPLVA
jgi:hypothetical protein